MCGLTGFWSPPGQAVALEPMVCGMASALAHRGPDDSGSWTDSSAGIAFGFRRLSIIDLSPHGHQPMVSRAGRYVCTFNGEIYNAEQMRQDLPGPWRGHSDTEVLLAAVEAWGLERAVKATVGMFAVVVWDTHRKTLHLVRDRIGKKPLYWGQFGGTLLWGSEIKALRCHPAFDAPVSPDALSLFLRYAYVPGPYTIYEGVSKLPPGMIATFDAPDTPPRLTPYWQLGDIIRQGQQEPFGGSDDEAVNGFHDLAADATRLRAIADVPLGAFLSGGLDSSLVVALLQAQSARPVQTFCVGFSEDEWNEAPFARQVARHLGTEHHEILATPSDALAVVPRLPDLWDEPLADVSQIPMFLVSGLARQHVTVALSGDGGDELLGGYYTYDLASQIRSVNRRLPRGLAPLAAKALSRTPRLPLGGTFSPDRLRKLGDALPYAPDAARLHQRLMSHTLSGETLVPGARDTLTAWDTFPDTPHPLTPVETAMRLDTLTYLPDDILVKVDRATMGCSLEARAPLLDHRLVEYCWKLPMQFKRRDGLTKWVLRQALSRYVPTAIFDRPKRGFGVPIGEWLRGPLRPWAEELLTDARLSDGGLLDPAPIRRAWGEHLSGRSRRQTLLWNVLMFQAWRERWK